MNWVKIFRNWFKRIYMIKESKLPGTDLEASKVLRAYLLTNNGRKVCIVIITKDGTENYPYTPELESGLLTALGSTKLEEQDFCIDYLIDFYIKNEKLISALSPFIENKNFPKNG